MRDCNVQKSGYLRLQPSAQGRAIQSCNEAWLPMVWAALYAAQIRIQGQFAVHKNLLSLFWQGLDVIKNVDDINISIFMIRTFLLNTSFHIVACINCDALPNSTA